MSYADAFLVALVAKYSEPCESLAFRHIFTHHAEDGSGVGSAIIAGMSLFPFMDSPIQRLLSRVEM